MSFDGQHIIVAVSAGIMVAPEARGQGIGLALRKRSFEGPQALTFTDGATDSAIRIWSKAGGELCQLYSCSWSRLLCPATHLLNKLRRRLGAAARFLQPFASLADRLLAKMPVNTFRFDKYEVTGETTYSALDILDLRRDLETDNGLQPIYNEHSLSWLLTETARAQTRGKLETVIVTADSGEPIGWYVYFANPRGAADVMQIGGHPDHIDAVINHMMHRAREAGSTVLVGQLDARFTSALVKLRCKFTFRTNFLMYSNNADILRAIHAGETGLTRLDGEWWLHFSDGPW